MQVSRLIRIRYGAVQLPRALSRGRFQELAPAWVEAWLHDLGIGSEEIRARSGASAHKPGGPKRSNPNRPDGGRQPDPMASTVSYFAKDATGPRRGKPGNKPGRPNGSRPDPMASTAGYFSQDPNGPRRGKPGGKPDRPSGNRQPDPMASTVNYIAQDPNGARRGKPGSKPGRPSVSRQPDPMTSTVNYIARGHGAGPRSGSGGQANFRRPKGRGGFG